MCRCVSGATILGNGTVALILDPQRLVQEAMRAKCSRGADKRSAWRTTGAMGTSVAAPAAAGQGMNRKANRTTDEGREGDGKYRLEERAGRSLGLTGREKGNAGQERFSRDPAKRCRCRRRSCGWWTPRRKAVWPSAARRSSSTACIARWFEGINEMLDAILLPIGEGNRILAQISDGKIDELIAHTYKGDHEKMKVAVNNVAIVLQGLQKELARLTEASKEGQLSRARQAGAVPGRICGDRARRERHARCDPAAHRRRQPHPGADLDRQDRRADRADLQRRPREDEAWRSTTWLSCCRACRKNWRG